MMLNQTAELLSEGPAGADPPGACDHALLLGRLACRESPIILTRFMRDSTNCYSEALEHWVSLPGISVGGVIVLGQEGVIGTPGW